MFKSLLAEGGFEVSARRFNGMTAFVNVRRVGFCTVFTCEACMPAGQLAVTPASMAGNVAQSGNGTFVVTGLATGGTVLLTQEGTTQELLSIKELPGDPSEFNYYGRLAS